MESSGQDVHARPETGARATKWLCWATLLAAIAFAAFVRVRLLDIPLERDEGEYAYAGQLILQGVPPYKLAYNMKLPGAYGAYALMMALFGQTSAGVHLGLLAVNAAAIVLMFLIGRRVYDARAGAIAALAYSILAVSPTVLGTSAHATHFIVLAALGGVLFLLKALDGGSRVTLFWSGICLGLAFLMKQPGALFAIFAVCHLSWVLLRERRQPVGRVVGQAALLAGAATIPFLLVCVVLAASGVFGKFWFWTFTYAWQYATRVPFGDGLQLLTEELGAIASPAAGLFAFAVLGLSAIAWDRKARTAGAFLGGFFVFSFLGVCPGMYFRAHYFVVWLPSLALLAGVGASALYGVLGASRTLRSVVVLPLLLFAVAWGYSLSRHSEFFFEMAPDDACRAMYKTNPFPESIELARHIRYHSRPGDTVAVIGSEPQIPFYACRRSATGCIYTYGLVEKHPYAHQMQLEMIEEIERARPRFLVHVNTRTSWLLPRDADMTLLNWSRLYESERYETVGLAERTGDGRTVYYWGREAARRRPHSTASVALLEAKDTARELALLWGE